MDNDNDCCVEDIDEEMNQHDDESKRFVTEFVSLNLICLDFKLYDRKKQKELFDG